MAINYQQILMEMNRPTRRHDGQWKRHLVALFLFLAVGAGAFAVWHYSLVNRAWSATSAFAGGLTGWSGSGETARNQSAATGAPLQNPKPESTALAPAPAALSANPVRVAAASNPAPTNPPAPRPNNSLKPPVAAPRLSQNLPSPAPATPTAPQTGTAPEPRAATSAHQANAAPPPVLSDAKAQIKAVDQMLTSNPAEALRRIEDLVKHAKLTSDEAAEAGYRMGYAARMLRDESKAESSWRETTEKYPALRGGRYSALALADTWFRRYAGNRPQISHWDDIQALYSRVLGEDDAPFLPENVKQAVKTNLAHLNDSLFFGNGPTKLARYHKVEPGELLGSIANKYRVDYDSIARINGINPDRIRVGMDLKLIVGDVSIVVRKNEGDPDRTPTVTWFLDGRWMREYPACIGEGVKTPGGNYSLTSKEKDPSWTNPLNGQLLPNDHPDNILGSRWMAMKGMNMQGLGIHGTTVDHSIPGYSSAGCIRLLNKDVEELFSFARIGGRVTVIE